MIVDKNGEAFVEDVLPGPSTAEEGEAEAKGREIENELAKTREILNADQLASLVAPRAHFEQDFAKFGAYFFTVDGVLNGRKITGALFAGECMLVFASTYLAAVDLATRALRSTVDLLHEEYRTRQLRGDETPVSIGMMTDAIGAKSRGSAPGQELSTLPKLKAIMATEIGGLPWKW